MSAVEDQDCAVCLQKCHHPTQLPCGHIFCFLCVKGVAIQSKKCAMCRAEIPPDYLDHPVLLEKISFEQTITDNSNEQYQWFYEGRNGWWKYDEHSNVELETAFNEGEAECTLLLAGALYCIEFQTMIQVRCSDTTRRRRVRRDTPLLPAKGIAGIKNMDNRQVEQTKSEASNVTSNPNNEVINVDSDGDDSDDDEVTIIEDDTHDVIIIGDSSEDNAQSGNNIEELPDMLDRIRAINLHETESPMDISSPSEDT